MDIEKLKNAVKNSNNYTQVCEILYNNRYRGNRITIQKYISEYNIDISHFTYRAKNKNGFTVKRKLNDILVENSTYGSTTELKKKLYKEGLKQPVCEMCGQDENWNGMKISMILDHINGVNNDNRIENLRIVCPNCNAGLPTHGGKNNKVYKRKSKQLTDIDRKKNKVINSKNQRKVNRPPYQQLLNEIKELGYCATGNKYNVSDNAIRKWVKFYENYENN